jgi:hypothetical protein
MSICALLSEIALIMLIKYICTYKSRNHNHLVKKQLDLAMTLRKNSKPVTKTITHSDTCYFVNTRFIDFVHSISYQDNICY